MRNCPITSSFHKCLGYHPWFSHWITLLPTHSKEDHYRQLFPISTKEESEAFEKLLLSLPDPITLESVLLDLRHNLQSFPLAILGEVGIDRSFHVPFDYFTSPRVRSPFMIPLEHQLSILEAQLNLAVELQRNVSLHSVKCQLNTVQLFDRMYDTHGENWKSINIDIHSCSLSTQTWRNIEVCSFSSIWFACLCLCALLLIMIQSKHSNVFLSLSTVINGRSPNYKKLIAACSPSRILVESDYNNIDDCTERTWEMLKIVAGIKGWHVEDIWEDSPDKSKWGAVRRLYENWKTFQRTKHDTSTDS